MPECGEIQLILIGQSANVTALSLTLIVRGTVRG